MTTIEDMVQDHEERIGVLEDKDVNRDIAEAADKVRFESLCKRLDDLICTIKWFIGAVIGISAIFAAILAAYIQKGGM